MSPHWDWLQALAPIGLVLGMVIVVFAVVFSLQHLKDWQARTANELYFKRREEMFKRQRELGDKLFSLLRLARTSHWQCSIWTDETKSSYTIWVEDRRKGAHVWANFFFIQVSFESHDDEFPIYVRGNPSGLFRYFGGSDDEVTRAARVIIDYLDAVFAEAQAA